jgi:hypothetical protein
MICGLDDMKTTIIMFFFLAFLSIIIYYFHERVQYLEQSVSRQNQVLSDFISNVQRQVVQSSHLGVSDTDIKVVKSDEMDKIVISEDEYDSESDAESDDDDESEADTDSVSDDESDDASEADASEADASEADASEEERGVHSAPDARDSEAIRRNSNVSANDNIKVIELIDNDEEDEKEIHLQEVHLSTAETSDKNVKKIELIHKEDVAQKEDGDGEMDVVGSKKMSVAELRALVVSKGLITQVNASKMKKSELSELLNK